MIITSIIITSTTIIIVILPSIPTSSPPSPSPFLGRNQQTRAIPLPGHDNINRFDKDSDAGNSDEDDNGEDDDMDDDDMDNDAMQQCDDDDTEAQVGQVATALWLE